MGDVRSYYRDGGGAMIIWFLVQEHPVRVCETAMTLTHFLFAEVYQESSL